MISALKLLFADISGRLMMVSAISAVTTLGIVHSINIALQHRHGDTQNLLHNGMIFSVAFLAYFIIQLFFQRRTLQLTEHTIMRVRLSILDAVRAARLANVEKIGPQKILAAIAYDANVMSQLNRFVVVSVGQLFTVIAALLYLCVVLPVGAVIASILFVLAALAYKYRLKVIEHAMAEGRHAEDGFFDSMHHLLTGIKENKQNQGRSDALFHDISTQARSVRDNKVLADSQFINNQMILMAAMYLVVAVVVFVVPLYGWLSSEQRMSFVIIILFLVSPFHSSMELFRVLAQLRVSKATLDNLYEQTKQAQEPVCCDSAVQSSAQPVNVLAFENAHYAYDSDGAFNIGPINFSVNAGEIVFISGGNGSGKTTLLKMLTGLYTPTEGAILLNGNVLSKTQYAHEHRQLFATVFADSVVFKPFYGVNKLDKARLQHWLTQANLADKVQWNEQGFSTTELSTGQLKRLALVQALMEQRPFLVLDEFAANLDPEFKHIFYTQWLPQLKKAGKTLLVITHDEQYFDVCDQHLLMREGQLHAYVPSVQPFFHAM
ncbi:cyclic peptide export ABC transporter [Pseudoalteromonas sp. MMG013]|uniref:cyclic peptide export ABC transporter n=1 Tax=Pseudoalteromonas sp. MMG013 TaxID=2822687 RepID=UPI001B382CBB|nr:cyclic peptide export ABC transporter [Pseudoalteromonas sp. MMG013]MBQ4863504.1 cyclic peptide export ABC transporter [Pseudoalteromonas sp. MMG013]